MPSPATLAGPKQPTGIEARKTAALAEADAWARNLRGDATFVTSNEGSRPDWFWTGKRPVYGECPGVLEDGTMTSLPLPDLSNCTRESVLDYFDNTWTLTEVVFSALQGEEAFYRPPVHNLRHPLIFYYAHPAALYVNKMRVAGIFTEGVNADYEFIFETGVDEMSWDDLSKNDMLWPSLREVTEYRRTVYNLVKNAILTYPDFDNLPITWDKPAWSIFMGFEHERIHLETTSVLMREMNVALLKRPAQWPAYHPALVPSAPAGGDGTRNPAKALAASTAVDANRMLPVAAGDVVVGKPLDFPSFGWDNEYGRRAFHVRAFKASKCLVSNAEFHCFLKDQGYHTQRFWTADGWKWRSFRNAKWPTFWVPDGPAGLHQYRLRLIFEVVDMPWDAPAVVNHHEAVAYCNWKSEKDGLAGTAAAYRLLTEPEHHRLRDVEAKDTQGRALSDPVLTHTGKQMRGGINSNLAFGAESPVTAMAASKQGFHDVLGNVWQHCEDFFAALPDSHGVHMLYDDFSTPCYDGQHNIILGGSFVSTGDESSVFARFHFRPHFFQHAGFRIVSGSGPPQTSCADSPGPHVGNWNPSTNKSLGGDGSGEYLLGEHLLSHYPEALPARHTSHCPQPLQSISMNYTEQVVEHLLTAAQKLDVPQSRCIQIGCGVGGVTFQLGCNFDSVLAVDLSAEAITAAEQLRSDGFVEGKCRSEGRLNADVRVERPVPEEVAKRITFRLMDPCCLQPDLGEFDAAVITSCLEVIPSPKAPLGRMSGPRGLVKPGGLLMVVSTFNWNENTTDRRLWLGGYTDGQGEPSWSEDGLRQFLEQDFELVKSVDMTYMTPRSSRRFEVNVAACTVWRRRTPA